MNGLQLKFVLLILDLFFKTVMDFELLGFYRFAGLLLALLGATELKFELISMRYSLVDLL